MTARTVSFGIRLTPEQNTRLVELAALQNQPKTRLTAIVVQEFLERNHTNGNRPSRCISRLTWGDFGFSLLSQSRTVQVLNLDSFSLVLVYRGRKQQVPGTRTRYGGNAVFYRRAHNTMLLSHTIFSLNRLYGVPADDENHSHSHDKTNVRLLSRPAAASSKSLQRVAA